MADTKWIVLSKTIAGIIIMLAGVFGVSELLPVNLADTLAQTIENVIVLVGAGISVWGRVTAKSSVTALPKTGK